MTVTRRILLQFAAAAGLVILVASGVTYRIVFKAAEDQGRAHLTDYVAERARVEEVELRHVRENLEMIRGQFVHANLPPAPPVAPAYQRQWDHFFELCPDGAWRSRRQFSDGRKWPTLWAGKNAVLTPELKTQIQRANLISTQALPGWVDSFPSLYFIFPQNVNIGFDPRIPNWVWDAPADYDNIAIEAVRSASPEANPSRGIVWNGVIAEPVSKSPYISVMLPVDIGGKHIATLGHDIHALRLLDESTRAHIDGVTHFIFRRDGRLIAHRELMPRLLASNGSLTMQDCGDPVLADIFRRAAAESGKHFSGSDASGGVFYAVSRLAGPEWFYVATMPVDQLRREAFASTQWVLWSGLLSLALVLTIMAFVLRRQIARPLAELTRATHQMTGGELTARAAVRRTDELGALAAAFNEMASAVSERDAVLERRVAERTAELSDANSRLAEASDEALRALAREKELGEMKSRFVSTVSHEFRNPLAIILSCSDVLQRMGDQVPPDMRREQIEGIRSSVQRMADMMEEVLLLGRAGAGRLAFEPEETELNQFCRRIVDQILSATSQKCRIHFYGPPQPFHGPVDRSLLEHILNNLLSNAVKYSPAGSEVTLQLAGDDTGHAVFTISDRGSGIPAQDMDRLYEPFHRGSNVGDTHGTGLGLVIVKHCVDVHGGSIHCESDPGGGTTFTVTLPIHHSPALP